MVLPADPQPVCGEAGRPPGHCEAGDVEIPGCIENQILLCCVQIPNLSVEKQAAHLDNVKREIAILKKLRGTLRHGLPRALFLYFRGGRWCQHSDSCSVYRQGWMQGIYLSSSRQGLSGSLPSFLACLVGMC